MAKRIFGFDLGIASIGWAVIELDKENVNPDDGMAATGSIKGTGVRCFTEALNAADRRASRGTRRSLRHKVLRMKNIRNLLRDEGIIDIKDSDEKLNTNRLYQPLTLSEEDIDVWKLRTKHAFERILTKREIGRILYHLAKHRGYDDETYPVKIKEIDSDEVKSEKEKSDEEKALAAIAKNIKEAIKSDKTMAQLLYEDGEKIRNGKKKVAKVKKDGTTKTEEIMTYNNSIPRSYIRMEARIILKKQKELGNDFFTDDIFLQWEKIAFRQRKFNESASYLKKSIESMIGMCKHEKGEKCAPKEAPTSELFVALTKINSLLSDRKISEKEKNEILALLYEKTKVDYKDIRKKLNLPKEDLFNGLDYENKKKKKKKDGIETEEFKSPEDAKFFAMSGWHKLKNSLPDSIMKDIKLLDRIMSIVAVAKTPEAIYDELKKDENKDIPQKLHDKIKNLSTSTFIKLSLKALYNIVPEMNKGLTYDKACKAIKPEYDPKDTGESFIDINDKSEDKFLKRIDMQKLGNRITSPVVKRTLSQFRKVYNAVIVKYGVPDQVNIEVGRELKKSPEERQEEVIKNRKNEQERQDAISIVGEKNVSKYRLYLQQDGKCIYCGKSLESELRQGFAGCQIDHILPYHRSLDNSFYNKVLTCVKCNQEKTGKTPYEWKKPIEEWDDFVGKVKLIIKNPEKRKKLLNTNFEDNINEFITRNSCDNATIANFVSKYLKDGTKNISVQARNGSLTAFLRHQWGLEKNRNESDKHHAQDAVVIACATQNMVTFLQTYSSLVGKDLVWAQSNGKIFKGPWKGFRKEVEDKLNEVFVSRPPRKGATGEAHDANPKSLKEKKKGIAVRHGNADRGNMFRFDVFCKDGKYDVVPIYIVDLIAKDKIFIPNGYSENDFFMTLHKDDYIKIKTNSNEEYEGYITQYTTSDQFVLYNNSKLKIFSIKTDVAKKDEIIKIDGEEYKVIGYNIEKNKVEVQRNGIIKEIDGKQQKNPQGKIKKELKLSQEYEKLSSEKSFRIGTITEIKKYQVDVLGGLTQVKFEKREPVNNIKKKDKAWRAKHRERKETTKGAKNGLANSSSNKTVQDIG